MALENRSYHVDPSKIAVLARRTNVASGLRLGAAKLSATPELFLRRSRLWVGGRFLGFRGGCGWHLPRDTTSISRAGLKQLDDGSLLGLEQFSRPFQPF